MIEPIRSVLGEPRQAGYVVADVDAAVTHWTSVLGVGPFYVADGFELADFRFRGQPAPITLKLALGAFGGLQIELIELLSPGPSDFHDFRKSHGEGLHHLGFWTQDFPATDAAMRQRGFEELHAGTTAGLGEPFVYFDHGGHPGTVIEVTQADGAKGLLFAEIEQSSATWDGTTPVRSLGEALARAGDLHAERNS